MNLTDMPIAEGKSSPVVVIKGASRPSLPASLWIAEIATLPFERKRRLLSERPLAGRRQGRLD